MPEMVEATSRQSERLTPHLALELRIRQLESLVGEAVGSGITKPAALRALHAKQTIDQAISPGNNSSNQNVLASIRRFVTEDFDANRRILNGGFSRLAGQRSDNEVSTGSNADAVLTPQEQILVLLESETQMRGLDRILSECRQLEQRGSAGSGKLADYETFQPRLEQLRSKLNNDLAPRVAQNETALFELLEGYQRHVDGMSRLFIQWDEALNDMDDKVAKLERDKALRKAQGQEV